MIRSPTVPAREWLQLLAALGLLAGGSQDAHAQPAGGAQPSIPGIAVVHVSPVAADTLPILCRDREHPELGFVTETGDAEWAPRFALSLARSTEAPDQAATLLELDGQRYVASFPAGQSGEGYYSALAEMTTEDGGARRMVSFTAHCADRPARGG